MSDEVNDATHKATEAELRSFIERWLRLDSEKKEIAEQQKEIMAEAKARGYDTKAMRRVISIMNRDKDDLAEEEAMLDFYRETLGV
jgi:uncharacterized protein (UPF0335 family)